MLRYEYDARDNADCSGVVDDDDDNNDVDDDGDFDLHLDGFAEWDLCSGEEDAGEGKGEESVWATWPQLHLIRYEIDMIGYHKFSPAGYDKN